MTFEGFIDAVRDGAGLDSTDEAHRTTHAVLGLLAFAISGGAVDMLRDALPSELGASLDGGPRPAQALTLGELEQGVAERQDVDTTEAANRIQAVIRVLVDTVGEETAQSIRAQLPYEMGTLFVADTTEGETAFTGAEGPQDPDASNVAGPERPVE